jgi:hypothetical protein
MKRILFSTCVISLGCAVFAHGVAASDVALGGVAPQATASAAESYADWYARNAAKIANRNALVGVVMQNLQIDLKRQSAAIEDMARLQVMLHSMPTEALERATALMTVSAVESLAAQSIAESRNPVRSTVQAKALGDQNQDLIFNPYGPCRIVDTRGAAAGAIAGGTARAFKNFNSTAQGTGTGNCNGSPSGLGTGLIAGTGGAIAITVTGVPPGATGSLYGNTGFLTARPVGDTNLTATVLIEAGTPFTAANSTIIRTSVGANDFEIYAAITSHVVVDLLGFYVPPAQTALDCQDVVATGTIPASGTLFLGSAACPTGYTRMSGGECQHGGNYNQVIVSKSGNVITNGATLSGANSAACAFYNLTATPFTGYTAVTCCRTPGSTTGRF